MPKRLENAYLKNKTNGIHNLLTYIPSLQTRSIAENQIPGAIQSHTQIVANHHTVNQTTWPYQIPNAHRGGTKQHQPASVWVKSQNTVRIYTLTYPSKKTSSPRCLTRQPTIRGIQYRFHLKKLGNLHIAKNKKATSSISTVLEITTRPWSFQHLRFNKPTWHFITQPQHPPHLITNQPT